MVHDCATEFQQPLVYICGMPEPRPPFDLELEAPLEQFQGIPLFSRDNLQDVRNALDSMSLAKAILKDPELIPQDITIPGPGQDLILTVFRRRDSSGKRPVIYFMHGGGMVLGDRFTINLWCFDWIKQLDVVLISIEFTNAPENTVPQVEECFEGLK